jgi:Ca2+-binding RTX toxin-like protein
MRATNRSLLVLISAAALVSAPTGTGHAAAPPAAGVSVSAVSARPSADARIARPASLKRTDDGYYYGAWGQNNKVTVTLVNGRLRFRDPRPVRWEQLAGSCRNIHVDRGVAASCRVPAGVSVANPLIISFEMRLGDDLVDTSALPAQFGASALLDAGVDEARTGPGADFVNGAFHRDVIRTGAGNDWIRSGEANDRVFAGDGRDRVVGGEADDLLHGDGGNDVVEGGPGGDVLYGDLGADRIKCGDGNDAAERDPADIQRFGCERTP